MLTLSLFALAASAQATSYTVQRFGSSASAVAEQAEVLPAAQYHVALAEKKPARAFKKRMLQALRAKGNYSDVLAGSAGDEEYLTDVTIGGQNFRAIVDTGSSDTWLVEKGFKCFNLTSYPEPASECGFGSSGFDTSKSSTYQAIPNKNFNISYGDGEFLTGTAAYETVTIGGLTVKKQEIGLATNTAWNGDDVSSGLVGLAFSDLTSIYNGTNPDKDGANNSSPYDPYFFTAVSEGVVSNPYFSVALDRGTFANQENSTYDPNLGYLAFGGIAPVDVTSTAVTVPIQGYTVSSGSKEYLWYTVDIDAYNFTGAPKLSGSGKQAILDTGTTLNYVPNNFAKAYNAKFKPAATYNTDEETYYVSCNATVPDFSVSIGGTTFAIDAKDQILPAGTDDSGKEVCISGTQPGGAASDESAIFILGDVFLHNVVATFNIKTDKVTLTERAKY